MPPTAPPHIRRIMLEKLKNKEPIPEPDLTTKPIAESQQGITPSPRKLNSHKDFPSLSNQNCGSLFQKLFLYE